MLRNNIIMARQTIEPSGNKLTVKKVAVKLLDIVIIKCFVAYELEYCNGISACACLGGL